MEKYNVLFNPNAGSNTGKAEAEKLKGILSGEIVFTDMTAINDYKSFFSETDKDTHIVIAGGDGTINRFVNDTDGIDIPNDILYYAAGSGNDFAHDLGRAKGDAPTSLNEYIKDLPTVTVNGKDYKFINGIGYGIDGYCCEVGDEIQRNSDKKVNYSAIAIKGILGKFKPRRATVTVDGVTRVYEKAWLAPTMNGRCYGGGLFITPNQDRLGESGLVSNAVVHHYGRLHVLMIFPSIGKGQHLKYTKAVDIREGNEITVRFDVPCALQIDGETYLNVSEYKVLSRKRVKELKAAKAAEGVKAEEPATV